MTVVAATLLVVAPAARAGTASTASFTCGSWQRVGSPNEVTGANADNHLFGVGVLSAKSAWAVGYFNPDTSFPNGGSRPKGHDSTLILHWNGTKWVRQTSTNGAGTDTDLYDVTASSASAAWAVGATGDLYAGSPVSAFAERWNGKSWTTVKTPSAANKRLQGVLAFKSTNAWAVGLSSSGGPAKALVEHWNGTRWTVVPTTAPSGSVLDDVEGLGPADIWAVGSASGNPFTMHYNGTSWKVVAAATPGKTPASLKSVSPVTHSNVLAAGIQGPFFPSGGATLVERFNGSSWALRVSHNPKGRSDEFHGIVAFRSDVGWAVGDTLAQDLGSNVLLEHLSGAEWVIDPFPQPGTSPDGKLPPTSFLLGVDGSSATDVWAVGSASSPKGNETLVLHRC